MFGLKTLLNYSAGSAFGRMTIFYLPHLEDCAVPIFLIAGSQQRAKRHSQTKKSRSKAAL